MTIADQITRLNNAKAAIKQSIENKGVEVSDSALLDEYPALIDSIEVGGGEGGGPTDSVYYDIYMARTKNGTTYSELFANTNVTTLDVSGLDTSAVTNMTETFYSCKSLTSLDLSSWDVSNVTTMRYMFQYCNNLTSLDVSNWNTSNVTNMYYLFQSCWSLTQLDVSNWNTSNVTDMSGMFYKCNNLTSLDLSSWDVSNVTNMNNMFNECKALTSLDLSNWDVNNVTNMNNFIYNCPSLVDFKAPKNINATMSAYGSNALSHDSLMSIINNLATVSTTQTLTLGATNLAKLTDEEIAIATAKNWTVK